MTMRCARCRRALSSTGTPATMNGLQVIVGPSCARILAGPQLELAPKRARLFGTPRRQRNTAQADFFGAAT